MLCARCQSEITGTAKFAGMDALPPVMIEIVNLVGLTAAYRISEHFGGQAIDVPKKASPTFVDLIGDDAAHDFCRYFAGTRLYISKWDANERQLRDMEIIDKYTNGTPVTQLSKEYGLSTRWIWNILKRTDLPEEPQEIIQQLSLF